MGVENTRDRKQWTFPLDDHERIGREEGLIASCEGEYDNTDEVEDGPYEGVQGSRVEELLPR